MNKHTPLLATVASIMIFAAGMLIGLGISPQITPQQNTTAPLVAEAHARVLIDPELGNGFSAQFPILAGETVGSLLQKIAAEKPTLTIATQSFGDMGTLITGINAYKNGDDNRYWQYWLNGEYGLVDAFKQPLADRDIIFWQFTKSQFNEL